VESLTLHLFHDHRKNIILVYRKDTFALIMSEDNLLKTFALDQ